jgi:solute carrier family 35 protein F1/2
MGMWGMIINGVQAAGLEYQLMRTAPWNGGTSKCDLAMSLLSADQFLVGFIFVYTFTMLVLYSECLSGHGT